MSLMSTLVKLDFSIPSVDIKIPTYFLDKVVKFDILRLDVLPNEIDWNSFGLSTPKFDTFYIGCGSNNLEWCNETLTTSAISRSWNTLQCQDIDGVDVCAVCYMQFFGLELDADQVMQR